VNAKCLLSWTSKIMSGLGIAAASVFVGQTASISHLDRSGSTITPREFLREAEHGLRGTWQATYRIVVNPRREPTTGSGTDIVAQVARPDATAWQTGSSEWMYRFTSATWGYEWIERAESDEDCWRSPSHPAWRCTGPGTFNFSIGAELSVFPFVPGQAEQVITDAVNKGKGTLKIYGSMSRQFGTLTCLVAHTTIATGTWCLDRSGFLVSEVGASELSFDWTSIALVRRSSSVSSNYFVPPVPLAKPFTYPPT
jgi:hypothetical protein